MVGVSYLILVYFIQFVNCDECPSVCKCLGNFVHCDKKELSAVPDNIPYWTVELNLNNNNIKKVTGEDWYRLENLTELKLNKNQIRNITQDSFNNLKQLKILELNRNYLESITALSFKSLENLVTLRLKRNSIGLLRDGAFFGLDKMQTLNLDYNRIEVISKAWLYGLSKLKDLTISNNRIYQINQEAWEFCSELITLDLSHNRLESIKRDTFKDLKSVRKLILNSNNISNIEEAAFSHTPRLEILQLNKNKISWLIEDGSAVLRNLAVLRHLTITSNNIKMINKNAFDGLKYIKSLDLSDNNITSIQNGAFKDQQIMQHLKINSTNLICDCHLEEFLNWLITRRLKIDAICSYPKSLRNHTLLDVSVNNLMCDDNPKPRLTSEPDSDIMALKSGNITLSCSAYSSSSSPMTFSWKKGNAELPSVMVVNTPLNVDGKSVEIKSELTISDVELTDTGKYQCIVSNRYGTTYSKKATIAVLIYPTFEKIPSNVTAVAGSTVRLECAAHGEPDPEIAWQKDGGNDFPAARERRMHVMPTDDVFFIVNAKPADMGVYSCIAHNPAGKIMANATLTIEEKPSFVRPMIDKEVNAGESVVLQCMAAGIPKPSIGWFKDGTPMKATERHFFTAEDQLMIIVDTSLNDAGTYVCNLNNSLGQVSGRSILSVRKPSGITENDKLGIIIITVVCCAVTTSIIWVVIIYHTRRRMGPPSANAAVLQLEATILDYPERVTNQFSDNVSEHSSCKDSGTGDSAKRSNDDLLPDGDYTLIVDGMNANEKSSMRTASLVYLSTELNRLNTPLLANAPCSFPVPPAPVTNSERPLNDLNEIKTLVSRDDEKEQ